MHAVTVNFNPIIELNDDQFYQLCGTNPKVKFERNAKGELIIMLPTGGETGNLNFEIYIDLGIWNRRAKLGVCFDSSTCFHLPQGSDRSPNVAWIEQERWDALTPQQKDKIPPICPDFVVELMSAKESLKFTQEKMKEYRENGVRLGWLINHQNHSVEIYRQEQIVEVLKFPTHLSGENVLPGFVLNLQPIWN
ncbi:MULTISPECIES: Uma2 family endonuclease [unclassified Coleofasciculus]|uniref:Uma2 family endonuclease n=1 Tax=unclassified Coleofasciculus TaxID=2692782 RepID=UPI001882C9EC|nr:MULTISPECIES: Uma2 family endonuclease [unclassified Coleofasciculus]MBE9125043.1 Uma2 family endonuclease [Coleofasciculus sp. LEGE 07081]MBE9147637.1 Uma2 family endonuclease [Coleofasciculus sp. LEGE 07092]